MLSPDRALKKLAHSLDLMRHAAQESEERSGFEIWKGRREAYEQALQSLRLIADQAGIVIGGERP